MIQKYREQIEASHCIYCGRILLGWRAKQLACGFHSELPSLDPILLLRRGLRNLREEKRP